MVMTRRLVITAGGQVSVPAAVRSRHGVRTIIAHDRGFPRFDGIRVRDPFV